MKFHAKTQARFEELIVTGEKIKATKRTDRPTPGVICDLYTWVDGQQAYQWAMSALAILKSTLGEDSDNYQHVKSNLAQCSLYDHFCIMQSCVKAALEDLRGGYFFDAKTLLEAEVFSDMLEQAEELQKAKYKDAAAVLAGGILEQHMRSMCARRGISLLKANGKHKMINDMNDDLAKAGAYNAMKKKQITAWADLRNQVAHGNYAAYSSNDVETFLQGISDLCANVS